MNLILSAFVIVRGGGDPNDIPYIHEILGGMLLFMFLICIAVAISDRKK